MSNAEIELAALLPQIVETIGSGGEFLLYPRGESMLPLIRPARDGVYLVRAEKTARNDIFLYRRENGRFVLHRFVRREKSGSLTFRGDNQREAETGVPEDALIARVSAVLRDGKRKNPKNPFYLFTHCSAPARALRFTFRKKRHGDG